MTAHKLFRTCSAGTLLALGCTVAQAAEPGSPGSMFQVVPGLALVLGLIAACAWVAKRIGPARIGGNPAIKFVSSQSLGGRDRVVIVEVNQQWLVLGVSPGRVNTLSQMNKPEAAEAAAADTAAGAASHIAKPPFAAWLEKALSKK
jgi:flagellar protein FliO/FliZ